MKRIEQRPAEQCPNCGASGGVTVTILVVETLGETKEVEGLRDCERCHGLPRTVWEW